MNFRRKIAPLVLVAVIGIAGCGSSSENSSASRPGATRKEGARKPTGEKKQADKFASFGAAASTEEREAASKILSRNLRARAAGDWEAQCTTLADELIRQIERTTARSARGESCASILRGLAQPLKATRAVRADTMIGPIDTLRVKKNRGYALYRGTEGKGYAIPMEKVGGRWKVDSLATTQIP